jgi:hypothetical protein
VSDEFRSTLLVGETTGFYPSLKVDTTGGGVVSTAGATLLVETIGKTGPWGKTGGFRPRPHPRL